jgi:aminoglycoside 3-N-acetyltransferase
MRKANVNEVMSEDLLILGLRSGGVVMVHSSLKSFGWLPQGAEMVIQALLGALGEYGTLLMPALTYETVRSYNPIFDSRSTPVCVGTIPETFRTRPGTQRSMHPTHSVCGTGPLVDELLSPHIEDSTPCGSNSPFHRLPDFQGQILMLGCGLKPNTSMHAIEELVEPPYLFGKPLVYTLIDEEGHITQKEYIRHNFCGWEQRYDRVGKILDWPHLKFGKVGMAPAYLIEASALKAAALAAIRKEPYFFVDPITI